MNAEDYISVVLTLPGGVRVAIAGKYDKLGDAIDSVVQAITMPDMEAELLFDPNEGETDDEIFDDLIKQHTHKGGLS